VLIVLGCAGFRPTRRTAVLPVPATIQV